ncbi:MAG: hypothetical protein H6Q26_1084, partial [Bacteroidetes bacterium]|nr:hypothetical protein [Bacteroidota bacterium]
YNLAQLYGKGAKQSCTLRWKQKKHWQAWARIEIEGTLTIQVVYSV